MTALDEVIRPRRRASGPPEPPGVTLLDCPSGLAAWAVGSGPRVLVVHGWQGRASQFTAFVAPLVAAGLQVVGIDGPAHGRSSGTAYNPAAHSAAICALGTGARGVLAHSLGAAAVIGALRNGFRPQRLAFLAPVRSYSLEVRRIAVRHGLDPKSFEGRITALLGRPVCEFDAESYDAGDGTVLCHDSGDRRIPLASTQILRRRWAGARVIQTRGLGHYGILRDPGVVAAVSAHLR